ncbi:integrase [Paracidovorax konjaci]|uniref:Site-specific recombinase XerD n=1 Tax=Paracidovorax konjaci TaxID=32040 RepID=A0A1I1Z511_9BURK|nr:integrase [Paracidovorax konjaci]SFE25420.1 Site-specific recombinase XerD [Paracidovorax konjaci]
MAALTQRANGHWQAKIRRKGWPDQSETFRSKSDAVAWARALEREMDVGSFINRDDAQRTTFSAAARRYSEEILPAKRGKAADASRLARLVEEFGSYSLASITPALLARYRDERLKAVSAQSVVHELGMVSRVLKAATMDWGIALPQGLPNALTRKPKVRNARDRRLEHDEEAALLTELKKCKTPWPHALTVLAIETAGRLSELCALSWKDIDLEKRTARLRGADGGVTKSGDAYRDIPLSKAAVALLESLPRQEGTSRAVKAQSFSVGHAKPTSANGLQDRVLQASANALQISFGRALLRARTQHIHTVLRAILATHGFDAEAQARELRAVIFKKRPAHSVTIEALADIQHCDRFLVDLRIHDFRHEATSRLASKLPMHDLMKVTGHRSSSMLNRYYHPRAQDLATLIG